MGRKKPIYGTLAVLRLCQIAGYDARLNPTAIRVLIILAGYANKTGSCFPAVTNIGKYLGVSRQAVTKQIAALEKLNYLRRVSRYDGNGGRRSNMIFLNLELAIQNEDCPHIYSDGDVTSKVAGDETKLGYEGAEPDEIASLETFKGYIKKTSQEKNIKIPISKKAIAYANSYETRKKEEAAIGWSEADQDAMDEALEKFRLGNHPEKILQFQAALRPKLIGLSARDRRLATTKALEEENARQAG